MRTLIIDDERLARKELGKLLEKFHELEVIGECANGAEAETKINEEKPDLIFLDIQMPEMNGFELLERLVYTPQVIFVTAYDDYALKAFDSNALDYLMKPVEEDRLSEAVEKVKNRLQKDPLEAAVPSHGKLGLNDQIFLKDGEKCWFVTLKDIRLFESEGNYVRVFFDKNKPLILKSLNALDDKLDSKDFFRANRKFIVNLKWVESIENWFNGGLRLTLKDGVQIEVSRRQSAKFRELMSL